MQLNDAVRMCIYVPTPKEAFNITKQIVEKLLHKKSVIKLKSNLLVENLRNITIHGYNFNSGGDG